MSETGQTLTTLFGLLAIVSNIAVVAFLVIALVARFSRAAADLRDRVWDRVAWLVVGALCAGLISPAAHAFEVLRADAACDHGVFRMRFEALLAAPATGVAAVLADYTGYGKLDARIRRVELLGSPPDGAVLMRTRIQVCAGISAARWSAWNVSRARQTACWPR